MIYILRQWQEGRVSGVIAHVQRHALPFEVIEAWQQPSWPELCDGDAVIALGGPASVQTLGETNYLHAFLEAEARFLGAARRRRVPILGICLSHQLLGRMAGQAVTHAAPVFGLCPVDLTPAGQRHWLFEGLSSRFTVHQNHGDYLVGLPHGAQLLASSSSCGVEAVAWDDTTVSTQFHPEFLVSQIVDTLDRSAAQLAHTGLTCEQMLSRLPSDYERYTERLFDNFLSRVARPSKQLAA